MSKFNLISFVIFLCFILIIESRPSTQKIVVHGHEWTVPNEQGWEEGKKKMKFEIDLII
jgi:hypothetical protein